MMDLNAGLMDKPIPGKHHSKEILVEDGDVVRGPELLTFRTNGGPQGKVKCRLSKKSAVL